MIGTLKRFYGGETWDQILNDTLSQIAHLNRTKGEEYKASDDDQLANFRRRAEHLGVPMEMVWAIYAGKHLDAIETYIKDIIAGKADRPRSEPIAGRIDDAIMYLILFKAIIAEREHRS